MQILETKMVSKPYINRYYVETSFLSNNKTNNSMIIDASVNRQYINFLYFTHNGYCNIFDNCLSSNYFYICSCLINYDVIK